MSTPNALLPCPFCGGISDLAEDTDRPHNPWTVFCESCDARTSNCVEPNQAIAAWNTRAAVTNQKGHPMSTPNALPVKGYYGVAGQVRVSEWLDTDKPLCLVSDALAAIAAASAAMKPLTCIWTEQDDDDMPGTYASACGEMWSFNDGGVVENNVRFCQGCGKPVQVTKAAP